MSLGPLPVELLMTLGGFCDYAQLVSLARANHTFHAIFNPILYKLNAADVPQKSCLHWAVEHDLLSTLKMAIAYGADINNTGAAKESNFPDEPPDDNGWGDDESKWFDESYRDDDTVYASPLHLAVLQNRPEMVRWLLDNNARLDVPSWKLCSCRYDHDLSMWYPLHFAMCHSNDEILCLLLERGALYSREDATGLYCAIKSGALSAVETITQVNTFDPNYRDSSHMTPLHWVHECTNLETAAAITERLVQRNVPVNRKDRDGKTALFYLIILFMLEPAVILLRHGADPTIDDDEARELGLLDECFHVWLDKKIQRAREVDPSKAEAMTERRLELAKLVIKGGVDVNGPLTYATQAPFIRPLF
ncbi:Ff.00g014710.m01.CDS01 [Fusarium sp. VM40]|nr:Ff.00g014710.m01.CDS01 [Fusarium sp. VM40]